MRQTRLAMLTIAAAFLAPTDQTSAQEAAAIVHIWTPQSDEVRTFGSSDISGTATTDQDKFVLASVSKTFLSVSILQADAQGLLDLDDWASDWLDADTMRITNLAQDTTVRHLLSMRSGVRDYITNRFMVDWLDKKPATRTVRGALTYTPFQRPHFAPGTEFDYANTNYLLAQLVLEAASGMSMADWFTKHIFEPAGMTNTFVFGAGGGPADIVTGWEDINGDGIADPIRDVYAGHGFGDGGAASNAADLVTFYKALFIDRILLDEAALRSLTDDPEDDGYGLGMAIIDETTLGHDGAFTGFSALAMYEASESKISVVLAADGDADLDPLLEETR